MDLGGLLSIKPIPKWTERELLCMAGQIFLGIDTLHDTLLVHCHINHQSILFKHGQVKLGCLAFVADMSGDLNEKDE